MVVDPLTNRIYVANQSDNSVSVIDGAVRERHRHGSYRKIYRTRSI